MRFAIKPIGYAFNSWFLPMPFDLSLTLVLQLAALGLFTGLLAGLLGVGGGMLMVPFLTAILSTRGIAPELAVKMAIATSMATILFTSIASVRAHHRQGAVRWDLVKNLAPGIVIGSMIGSMGVFGWLKGAYLALFFGVFVSFSATQMFIDKKPKATRQMPELPGQLAAGGFIGFLSGLVGAGGGFISVPFMTWCNVPIRNAVATSAALGFPIALANVLGYVVSGQQVDGLPPGALGYIWVPGLAIIAAGSFSTAPIGARMAHNVSVSKLKRIFACILYVLGAYMLYQGVTSLAR